MRKMSFTIMRRGRSQAMMIGRTKTIPRIVARKRTKKRRPKKSKKAKVVVVMKLVETILQIQQKPKSF